MRVLPRPHCHAHQRSTFVTLRRDVYDLSFVISHADNATIEAATREYGVDAERIRAWLNREYYTYRRASRSTIRSLPRIEAGSKIRRKKQKPRPLFEEIIRYIVVELCAFSWY